MNPNIYHISPNMSNLSVQANGQQGNKQREFYTFKKNEHNSLLSEGYQQLYERGRNHQQEYCEDQGQEYCNEEDQQQFEQELAGQSVIDRDINQGQQQQGRQQQGRQQQGKDNFEYQQRYQWDEQVQEQNNAQQLKNTAQQYYDLRGDNQSRDIVHQTDRNQPNKSPNASNINNKTKNPLKSVQLAILIELIWQINSQQNQRKLSGSTKIQLLIMLERQIRIKTGWDAIKDCRCKERSVGIQNKQYQNQQGGRKQQIIKKKQVTKQKQVIKQSQLSKKPTNKLLNQTIFVSKNQLFNKQILLNESQSQRDILVNTNKTKITLTNDNINNKNNKSKLSLNSNASVSHIVNHSLRISESNKGTISSHNLSRIPYSNNHSRDKSSVSNQSKQRESQRNVSLGRNKLELIHCLKQHFYQTMYVALTKVKELSEQQGLGVIKGVGGTKEVGQNIQNRRNNQNKDLLRTIHQEEQEIFIMMDQYYEQNLIRKGFQGFKAQIYHIQPKQIQGINAAIDQTHTVQDQKDQQQLELQKSSIQNKQYPRIFFNNNLLIKAFYILTKAWKAGKIIKIVNKLTKRMAWKVLFYRKTHQLDYQIDKKLMNIDGQSNRTTQKNINLQRNQLVSDLQQNYNSQSKSRLTLFRCFSHWRQLTTSLQNQHNINIFQYIRNKRLMVLDKCLTAFKVILSYGKARIQQADYYSNQYMKSTAFNSWKVALQIIKKQKAVQLMRKQTALNQMLLQSYRKKRLIVGQWRIRSLRMHVCMQQWRHMRRVQESFRMIENKLIRLKLKEKLRENWNVWKGRLKDRLQVKQGLKRVGSKNYLQKLSSQLKKTNNYQKSHIKHQNVQDSRQDSYNDQYSSNKLPIASYKGIYQKQSGLKRNYLDSSNNNNNIAPLNRNPYASPPYLKYYGEQSIDSPTPYVYTHRVEGTIDHDSSDSSIGIEQRGINYSFKAMEHHYGNPRNNNAAQQRRSDYQLSRNRMEGSNGLQKYYDQLRNLKRDISVQSISQ